MSIPLLYLSRLGGLGGGETILLTHLLALERTRFAPHVICGANGALVDELRAHNVPATVIPFTPPYFKRGIVPIVSLDTLPRLAAYLRREKIALIHCNDLESVYYAAPLAKAFHLPVVLTCLGWWLVDQKWKAHMVDKMVARIVTPTCAIRNSLVQMLPRLAAKITLLPFGVDTREFAPRPLDPSVRAEFKLSQDAPLLTILARFQSVKGHANFLEALPKILDAFPQTRVLFVGDAEFETRDATETRAEIYARVMQEERLRNAIVFAGFRRDIPRILNATDLLVSPSWFETYGMAIVEAMACAVPVVSTNVGGPSETMADGETGFLIPPHDPETLAARVIELLAQPELRQRFGKNARTRVEKQFALRDSVRTLESLYQMILK
ncbi:MAG: glycosyltransferase family 1 protein [Chloroflexota bacterium]|nr:MAG: glycosyltransferase family 1 protein [Chloroflexota bacterium]